MTKRSWLPAEWMDESIPALGDSPDQFIRTVDSKHFLASIDDADDHWLGMAELSPGQLVNFMWHEPRGTHVITIAEDGTWKGTVPTDANCLHDGDADYEEIWDNVDDIVRQRQENEPKFAGPIDIECWVWSDGTMFRFSIEDGKPKFLEEGTVQ